MTAPDTAAAPQLSLVIVAWNSAELLGDSIGAFRASAEAAGAAVEVVVVDNCSADSSIEAARAAGAELVLENPLNVGFVVAASQGIARARSPWILLANPDLRVDRGFVGAVLAAAARAPADVAALVPDVRFASAPSIINSRGLDVDELGVPAERESGADAAASRRSGEVFGPSSSASILRVDALEQVGGLEPAYFAYLEDVDVAWRLRRAGYRAELVPEAFAVHEGSASTGEGSWLKAFLVARNRRILFRLHGPHDARARALRAVTEAGHATVQTFSGSRDASVRGRLSARRTRRYARFVRASAGRVTVPGVRVPLVPRFTLLETLRRKQTASLLMHHESPAASRPPAPRPSRRRAGPVRVLVDAANLKPGQGGIRTYTMGLIRALAGEQRLELVVAASVPEVAELGAFELVPLAPYTRSVAGRAAWRETHLPSLVRRVGADVVVAPVPELPLRRLSVPTVVVVHDVGPFVAPAFYTRNKRLRYMASSRQACRLATAIVCVSQATLVGLRSALGVDASRCVVVGEGPQLLDPPEDVALPVDEPYVLYVGSLDPRKNVDTLVAAVVGASPPLPAKLVVAGPAEPDEIARLGLKAAGVHDRVAHLGFVDADVLAGLYRSAVAVALPSLYEGFGLPVIEAFNAGTPVVVSDISTLREVAGEGALYVDEPLASESWRVALRTICDDVPRREELRRAGYEVLGRYEWEAVAERFADVVVATVGGRPASVEPALEPAASTVAGTGGD